MPSLRRTNVAASGGYNPAYGGNNMNNMGYQNMPNMSAQVDPMAVQQPVMQNTMIPHQSNIIWIDNENEIPNYPTGRGWQQWFGNKNEQILYIRDTDTNGVIQPIVRVKYEVIEDQPTVQQGIQQTEAAVPTAPVNTNQYVDRNEFEDLNKKLKGISDNVNGLIKTLDNMQDKLADLLK
jgi:hypothetical protein